MHEKSLSLKTFYLLAVAFVFLSGVEVFSLNFPDRDHMIDDIVQFHILQEGTIFVLEADHEASSTSSSRENGIEFSPSMS